MPEAVVVTQPDNPAADVEAARAAAAAATASEAAAAAMVQADIAAANNAQSHEERIAAFEGSLNECRGQVAALTEAGTASKAETDRRFGEMTTLLSSIQTTLEKLPAAPPNPKPAPTEGGPVTGAETPPGNGEAAPPKRKAHRWI